ncbi:response regulator [Listeria monocytogenes]|nr:response regulator [Listeria monocytogenes]
MLKLLIVDDAMFMRTMIKNIVKDSDFEVVAEAENGLEAVKKYDEVKPDIVTLDITMPEMDGLEALAQIMAKDPSAKGQQGMVVDAIKKGAKDFIVKPFQADRVLEALEKAAK